MDRLSQDKKKLFIVSGTFIRYKSSIAFIDSATFICYAGLLYVTHEPAQPRSRDVRSPSQSTGYQAHV